MPYEGKPYLSPLVLLFESTLSAQSIDSTNLPALWLRADSGLVFILFSCANAECKNARKQPVGGGSQHQVGMNARDSLLGDWRNDSLGCLHIRNYELSTVLEKKYDLTHKGVDEIMTILGNPNKTIRENKALVLRYYCNSLRRRAGRSQHKGNKEPGC